MGDTDVDLLATVARLYYLDERNQGEIAEMLGVSRSTVSRLLAEARQRGIVEIKVRPFEPRNLDLERRIQERLGLRLVVVVRARNNGVESVRRTIGYFAAPAVAELIRPRMTIGVAGGRTVGELVGAVAPVSDRHDVSVVQLLGQIDPTARRTDPYEVGRTLAQCFGGSFFALNAPAFARDRETRDSFLNHEQIRQIWRRFETVDLALVGVGTLAESVFADRGLLDDADFARLRDLGAVGETCGRFFDRDGRECGSDYRDRVISIPLEELQRRPEVVAVTNGPFRSEAIIAALRGGLVTSLVIDEAGATALLQTNGPNGGPRGGSAPPTGDASARSDRSSATLARAPPQRGTPLHAAFGRGVD